MNIQNNITGIILAGGKSSRMGFDKGLANIKELKMIEMIISIFEEIFYEILIIANNSDYENISKHKVYSDIYKNKGPLGGIFTGLKNSTNTLNFVISCDTPFISKDLVYKLLTKHIDQKVLIVSVQNKLQPLFGLYSKQLIENIEELLTKSTNSLSLKTFIKNTDSEIIDFKNESLFDEFLNINTQADLEYARNKI